MWATKEIEENLSLSDVVARVPGQEELTSSIVLSFTNAEDHGTMMTTPAPHNPTVSSYL
jgi:hypothetical protein